MAWKASKRGITNFICGTAHFFPHRFGSSLQDLIRPLRWVLLEGPLDEGNMEEVRQGAVEKADGLSLAHVLDDETLGTIGRAVAHSTGSGGDTFSSLAAMVSGGGDDLKRRLSGLKPWMGFFCLWSEFLRKRGWRYSVDLEAYAVARKLGKETVFLETIEEQLRALEEIPLERIVAFLSMADQWGAVAERHRKLYLAGDLAGMVRVTGQFPTRCSSIIDDRDGVLYGRARPFFDRGGAALFVGTTHLWGIRAMLEEDGYTVTPWEG
jgi:hypothetical protein